MKIPNNIANYLERRSDSRWNIETKINRLFDNIIVVPAINERNNIYKLLKSLSNNSLEHLKSTLIIFVINNSSSEASEIKEENKKTIEQLREVNNNNKFPIEVGFVDATNGPFSDKNCGVGLARKIGMDLALKYFNYINDEKEILISLDADCLVSDNYIEEIVSVFKQNEAKVAVASFEHILPENEIQKLAIINYEIFLRYYVLALKFANSNYAYHSVGSTIICDAESYVKVGGMNKKKAGEDFYFLEKLAKIEKIQKVDKAIVYPSARISLRVPFGTGPRIKRFIDNRQDEYLLYSPKSFEILRKWLSILFFNESNEKKDGGYLLEKSFEINSSLHKFLQNQSFEFAYNSILKNSKSEEQLIKQKNNWMDGFRTLKLIHYLRDNEYPNINMFDALNIIFEKCDITHSFNQYTDPPSISIQTRYLNLLNKNT